MKRITYTLLFVAVLWGGFFIAAVNTLCDDTGIDW